MSTGVHEEPGPFAAAAPPVGPVERAEQRAETMRALTRMSALEADHPQRARLRAEVIEDHMAYARHLAGHYGRRGVSDEDFAQVAYLGLVKAVDNFDPERGTGFLGYATPVIIGEIKRYFRDATWDVHVPRRMQEVTGALRRAREELTARAGREPTVGQLAEHVGCPFYLRAPTVGIDGSFVAGLGRLVAGALKRPGIESGCGGRICPRSCGKCPAEAEAA